MQRPLRGKFYTALAHIFKTFRHMKRKPPICVPGGEGAERVELITLASNPGKNGKPAEGREFVEEWEMAMLRAHSLGGDQAEILTDSQVYEYLSVPTLYDPFT